MTPPPKPARGPDPAAMRDVDDFAALTAESVRSVRESAERWRTGMAALVTLVTTALLLKGPEKAADLPLRWRLTLTVLLGLGLALAIAALWRALQAAAGEPGLVRAADIRDRYVTVTAFRVAQARRAAVQLKHARWLLVPALALLAGAMLTWWWAPPAPAKPLISIDYRPSGTSGTRTACGELTSADDQTAVVERPGTSRPTKIAFSQIENMRVPAACP
ncbi:hypothetical protein [Actinomadura latina]|uniref:Uncharacterized protein n=1 Tax=Actinomadura latina TaxID=163603 RepID=A0A846YZY2_9ACTN|nr:hypothetical protein [Actinomadura latina]NKZ05247.1 hypothetical protein [Actinomadura latina]